MKVLSYNKELKHKVIYTNSGLANVFDDGHIEINKKLLKYPKLHNYILKHELGHKKEFDLSHEFKFGWEIIPLFFIFIFTPSMWVDLLPVQRKGKYIVYDLNMIILYSISSILIIILIFILIKIL